MQQTWQRRAAGIYRQGFLAQDSEVVGLCFGCRVDTKVIVQALLYLGICGESGGWVSCLGLGAHQQPQGDLVIWVGVEGTGGKGGGRRVVSRTEGCPRRDVA